MTTQPSTPEEWQAAVDAAEGALAAESARQYGLVTGGPIVNVDRCVEILDAGRERGIMPSPDAVEKFMASLVHEAFAVYVGPSMRFPTGPAPDG